MKSTCDLRGLNVVFINMPLRETAVPNTTPQGPLLLATILRDNYGINATIIDLNGYRIQDEIAVKRGLPNGRHLTDNEAFELIKRHFEVHGIPDVVGLSGMITTLRWQGKIAKMVRQLAPDVFLVSGGGLATELKLRLFNYIPELNAVARGEGDDIMTEIINESKKAGKIKNQCHFLYEGRPRDDLDTIPFADLELLKKDVFGNKILETYIGNAVWGASANNSSAAPFTMKRSTTFVSSRGCPYACAFCYKEAQGNRKYRMRSAENLAEEMRLHIAKYGVDFIGMPDDNFAVSYKRVMDLVPLLRSSGVRWGTHARLDESDRFKLMAEAGCIYIGFGAESASPAVLEAMRKGGFILRNGLIPIKVDSKIYEFPRTMVEGIMRCEDAGIHANCTWIMGYPGETLDDLKMSVAFIKWQEDFYLSRGKPTDSVNKKMFVATAYPGTEMFCHPKVTQTLNQVFGIRLSPTTGEPLGDENFRQYILELDDATKVLSNPKTGKPLNFSDMPDDIFLRAREYINSDQIYKILEM